MRKGAILIVTLRILHYHTFIAMNKILLLVAAAATAFSAAGSSFDYTCSFNPYGSVALPANTAQPGDLVSQAVAMPAEMVNALAGNQITSINIFSPSGNQQGDPNPMTEATVFLSHGINEEPFYTANVTLSSTAWDLNRCTIDPYTITAGETIFIGWKAVAKENAYYIAYDNDKTTFPNQCLIRVGEEYGWSNYADKLGNLCIGATVSGENLPATGVMIMGNATYPSVADAAAGFPVEMKLRNVFPTGVMGVNIEYTVGEETKTLNNMPVTTLAGNPTTLAYNAIGKVTFDVESSAAGVNLPLKVKITGINGSGVNAVNSSVTGTVTLLDSSTEGFDRNVVIEEATGTWCVFCPAGMVMMEKLGKEYTDGSVIRIAVHASQGSSFTQRDPMQVADYLPFIYEYCQAFPTAWVNRTREISPSIVSDPVAEFSAYYETVRGSKSPFKVEVEGEAVEEGRTYEITARVTSVFDLDNSNDRYRLSLVTVEDGVGPYNQANGYAGGKYGPMDGWENKPNPVEDIYFNDVARNIFGYPGLEHSIPAEWTANTPVEVSRTASLDNILAPEVRLVAMLVDTETGEILNAAETTFATGLSGIGSIAAADKAVTTGETEYFTLQGVRVANPQKGCIYIVRNGNEVSKTLVK